MMFGNFGMYVDLTFYYNEYCAECETRNENPKDIRTWWEELE